MATLYESWGDVEGSVREQMRLQLRYLHDLLPFLEEPQEDLGGEPEEPDDQGDEPT
jgi:hypothetical protein